jgi:hypothetical protein
VTVLVAPGCTACVRVPDVVAEVRRLSPSVEVTVIDLGSADLPEGVPYVGTPAYLIGARIVSLGNPDPLDLVTILEGWPSHDGP